MLNMCELTLSHKKTTDELLQRKIDRAKEIMIELNECMEKAKKTTETAERVLASVSYKVDRLERLKEEVEFMLVNAAKK